MGSKQRKAYLVLVLAGAEDGKMAGSVASHQVDTANKSAVAWMMNRFWNLVLNGRAIVRAVMGMPALTTARPFFVCLALKFSERNDALGWTRTSGLLLRRQSLYPPELQARTAQTTRRILAARTRHNQPAWRARGGIQARPRRRGQRRCHRVFQPVG